MSEDEDKSPQRRVGSVRQAIAILRYLETLGGGAGVNPLARALDISPSSCFNLLKTLADEDFLEFDPRTKQYSLGVGAISLGRRAFDPLGAYQLIQSRLEALADRRQITTSLLRPRRGDQLILIGLAESAAAYRIQLSVGQRLPIATGAAGRCAMAFSDLDATEIRRRFDAVKWGETPDWARFMSDVEKVRRRGWAIDEGQFIKGVTTLSAPALGPNGALAFIISATMFTGQHAGDELTAIGDELGALGAWLSSALGGPKPTSVPAKRPAKSGVRGKA